MLVLAIVGARKVQVGRSVLWGLAVVGEAGVRQVLELLTPSLTWRWPCTAAALSGMYSGEVLQGLPVVTSDGDTTEL